MLLAAWLLGPIDALRAVATFHYLIAALGAYALARQLRRAAARGRPSARSPSRPRGTSSRAPRRSACWAARPGSLRRWRWRRPPRARARAQGLRDRGARGRARVRPRQRIAAARRAHAGDLRDLADRARGRARGAVRRRRDPARARAWRRWRCCRGSSCCGWRPRPATSTPTASARSLFGDRRGARRSLRRLALGDRDALPRRRHARARADRRAARLARRRPGAPAGGADRALARVGDGPRRLGHGSAAARAHGGGSRARARHRARPPVRVHPGGVRARRSAALARGRWSSRARPADRRRRWAAATGSR